ncbi:peripheral myelin protein 22-like [Synchiropus splendidus]|uniref:peripheral myelin protein 22-like n=1 Tax=Synchiropus splendidus TaxID=270530 RepID=UPI00237DCDAE|nr:peripheral myelin protein 22-like [Synchiropus splendidus]
MAEGEEERTVTCVARRAVFSGGETKWVWGVGATSGIVAREKKSRETQNLADSSATVHLSTPRPREQLCLLKYLKMLLILLGVLILHLIILLLLIISTAASTWTVSGTLTTDLWYSCSNVNGGYHCKPASNEDWIQAVQALMILSLLFCFFALIAFVFQLFKLVKGGRFFFTAIFQILASLFVMCAAIIYTVMSPDNIAGASFGYAYVLAWVAFPLCLISGLIYIVLRKKE